MALVRRFVGTKAPGSVLLIRLIVGAVFVSEGVQKFLFPELLGVGRFTRIGIPNPGTMATMVGVFEIVCGALILLGLLTRLAAIPMMINMLVAVASTKIPILLGQSYWMFRVSATHLRPEGPHGFWVVAHESRVDFAMLLASLFLLIVGAGWFSLDALITRRRGEAGEGNGAKAGTEAPRPRRFHPPPPPPSVSR